MTSGPLTSTSTIAVWCEVCGREEGLSAGEAFDAGWDFAGLMPRGIVSPRTCPDHGIEDTVWAKIAVAKIDPADFTEHDRQVIARVVAER
ncbi:hypothetical protein [Microbacterium sp. LBN7]|uniref:hypothetical protein n=1 Tax=Microbacterium sp. LBN7 TaxID=3129773 RepID=UPI00324FE454